MADELKNFGDYSQQQEETIDFKAIVFKIFNSWYLFAIAMVIALVIAFLFNKYSKPVYEVSATILVQDEQGTFSTQELIGLGLSGNKQNLENEIGILKSYTVANRAVKALELEVSYFTEDNFIIKELYEEPPFRVLFDRTYPQATGVPINIKILNQNEYELDFEGEDFKTYLYKKDESEEFDEKSVEFSKKFAFGEWVQTDFFRFKIDSLSEKAVEDYKNKSLYFKFNDMNELTKRFQGFSIEPINREASIVKISLKGDNKQKSVDFLNMLSEVYIDRGLEKKNQIATNTIKFIDAQLNDIRDSLNMSEMKLQNFRSKKEILNLEFQGEKLFEQMKELQNQQAELIVKRKYYDYLKEYLVRPRKGAQVEDIIVPSSMGIEDPVLAELISRLTDLYAERAKLSFSTKKETVLLGRVNSKIDLTQRTIIENVNNIINTSKIAVRDINNRIDELTLRMSDLPSTQRQLFNIERQFTLLDNIYTFLMQKRSDAQITKASNLPDNEIIDIARVEASEKVFPKTTLNYLIALLLGLLLPLAYVFGREYFNDKIMERKDLEGQLQKAGLLGHILHNDKDTNIVVHKSPKSSISESFRSVRTNLEFVTKSRDKATILITSVIPGEGKTFVAENLALSYASYGKKTLLVGFDMRKPKIYQDFGINNLKGLSTYLIHKDSLEDSIQKTEIESLDLLMAGPVPPNPAEIIASDNTQELFVQLKKYMIISLSIRRR